MTVSVPRSGASATSVVEMVGRQQLSLSAHFPRTLDASITLAVGSYMIEFDDAKAAHAPYDRLQYRRYGALPHHGDPKLIYPIPDVSKLAMSLRVRGGAHFYAGLRTPNQPEQPYLWLAVGETIEFRMRDREAARDFCAVLGQLSELADSVYLRAIELPAPRIKPEVRPAEPMMVRRGLVFDR